MELCAAEFSSVSASSGVAEATDAGVAFSVALSAGDGWPSLALPKLLQSLQIQDSYSHHADTPWTEIVASI